MRTIYNPGVLAQDVTLGSDRQPVRVDPQADRPIGERGWHAVAVALEGDQAGWRYALGLLDKAIERPPHGH